MLLMALLACQTDTSFNNNTTDVTDVAGTGNMELSETEMTWTEMTVGNAASQTLFINSVGELNLVLYEARLIATGNGAFYIEETEDKVIAPGSAYELIIVANVDNDNLREGTLRLKTNDLDNQEVLIPLTASTGTGGGDDTGGGGDDTGGGGDTNSPDDTGNGPD